MKSVDDDDDDDEEEEVEVEEEEEDEEKEEEVEVEEEEEDGHNILALCDDCVYKKVMLTGKQNVCLLDTFDS